MCGIAGFISFGKQFDYTNIAKSMGKSLSHRGPDSNGQWVDEGVGVGLIHQRLSIMDLSIHGHQPMHSANERFVMVFNGEIYNHQDIRKLLDETSLINWRGHSDTETLIQAFTRWGVTKTLEAIVGMFAIALWDRDAQKLYLARDRMGEKPLYYGFANSGFVFASELKAIKHYPGFKSEINLDALHQYLAYNYVPEPMSIYQGLFKLKPGHYLEIGLKSEIKQSPYWQLRDVIQESKKAIISDEESAIAEVKRSLSDAIQSQCIADVPVGAFLSGGIDSSTIVALMQAQSSKPINTFTIGFHENAFDEARFAHQVAKHLGTNHHEIILSSKDCQTLIPNLSQIYDEPFADSSQIPTCLVAKIARQHVSVALSGDGGDEFFGGYSRYQLVPKVWQTLKLIPKNLRFLISKGLSYPSTDFYNALNQRLPSSRQFSHFGQKVHKLAERISHLEKPDDLYRTLLVNAILPKKLMSSSYIYQAFNHLNAMDEMLDEILDRMMYLDSVNYLPGDILTKVDRAAMSVSLETRVPFLDHRVIETAWKLHPQFKISNRQSKWILRKILQDFIPLEMIERPKMGFGIPLREWLSQDLKEWAQDLLSYDNLNQHGLLDAKFVHQIWQEHQSGLHDWSFNLWNICMFQAWYKEHI